MSQRQWLADLYRDCRQQLFVTAWSVLRQADLAEDAVHAAFVGLARLAQAPAEPKLYVFKAVRNAAIDLASVRARRRERPIENDCEPLAPGALDLPDAELVEAARKAIEELEDSSREVVDLHLHANLTFQEVADLLGEPLSTVASRYRRALEKVRSKLEVRYE